MFCFNESFALLGAFSVDGTTLLASMNLRRDESPIGGFLVSLALGIGLDLGIMGNLTLTFGCGIGAFGS